MPALRQDAIHVGEMPEVPRVHEKQASKDEGMSGTWLVP